MARRAFMSLAWAGPRLGQLACPRLHPVAALTRALVDLENIRTADRSGEASSVQGHDDSSQRFRVASSRTS